MGQISQEDRVRLESKVYELEMDLHQGFGMAASINDDAYRALGDLAHSRGRPLGKKLEFALISPTGEKVQFKAKDGEKPLRQWFEFWRWLEPPPPKVTLDDVKEPAGG